jgi:hypothetical protein
MNNFIASLLNKAIGNLYAVFLIIAISPLMAAFFVLHFLDKQITRIFNGLP